jgi:hypothetical protein
MTETAIFNWAPPGKCRGHRLYKPKSGPKDWFIGETFVINIPERQPIRVTRDQLNPFSSEFNCENSISLVGSDDFVEALADFIFEIFEEYTNDVETVSPEVLMSWVDVVE